MAEDQMKRDFQDYASHLHTELLIRFVVTTAV